MGDPRRGGYNPADEEKHAKPIDAKEHKLEGSTADQIHTLIEMFATETKVFGPAQIEKSFGVELKDIPEIPFSAEMLERAAKLGFSLVLRVDKAADGNPMTLEAMNKLVSERWKKEGKGPLLDKRTHSQGGDNSFDLSNPEFTESVRSGWVLLSKEVLPGCNEQNYFDQTKTVVQHLEKVVFKGMEIPKEYAEAIAEFKALAKGFDQNTINEDKYSSGKETNADNIAKILSELKITQLTRQSAQEIAYDFVLDLDSNNRKMLVDQPISTSTTHVTKDSRHGDAWRFVHVSSRSGQDGSLPDEGKGLQQHAWLPRNKRGNVRLALRGV